MLNDTFEQEFEGLTYQCKRLGNVEQIHIIRRFMPEMMDARAKLGTDSDNMTAVFMVVFGKLSQEDVNYILNAALSQVKRKKEGDTGWADVWEPRSKRMMFEDIPAITVMEIAFWVIMSSSERFG